MASQPCGGMLLKLETHSAVPLPLPSTSAAQWLRASSITPRGGSRTPKPAPHPMTVAAVPLHHGAPQTDAYKCEFIFGFGSLISKPGFEYSDKVEPCYIKGWRRVFWQGSTDHRGTPEAPGRTVTLEPCEGAVTWGTAFKLAGDAEQRHATVSYLEWREKQYDLREIVPVFTPASSTHPHLTALVYIATSDRSANPNYLGPAPLDEIAHQIATSSGPSGPNCEYLFHLADAMRRMSVQDEDLFLLEAKVRTRLQLGDADGAVAADGKLHAASSGSSAGSNNDESLASFS